MLENIRIALEFWREEALNRQDREIFEDAVLMLYRPVSL